MPSILKRLLDRGVREDVLAADENRYYAALINEARTEDERIRLDRAVAGAMRRQRAS